MSYMNNPMNARSMAAAPSQKMGLFFRTTFLSLSEHVSGFDFNGRKGDELLLASTLALFDDSSTSGIIASAFEVTVTPSAYQRFMNHPFSANNLSTLRPKMFPFLWYVYNRGGICNRYTMELFTGLTQTPASRKFNTLIKHDWLKPLYDPSIYVRTDGRGRKPKFFCSSWPFKAPRWTSSSWFRTWRFTFTAYSKRNG